MRMGRCPPWSGQARVHAVLVVGGGFESCLAESTEQGGHCEHEPESPMAQTDLEELRFTRRAIAEDGPRLVVVHCHSKAAKSGGLGGPSPNLKKSAFGMEIKGSGPVE